MGKLSDRLLDLQEAYARKTDPGTSHAAARSMKPETARVEGIVANAVINAGERGLTCDEICTFTGISWKSASPRLKPLVRKRIIKAKWNIDTNKPMTRTGKSGRGQIVWIKY